MLIKEEAWLCWFVAASCIAAIADFDALSCKSKINHIICGCSNQDIQAHVARLFLLFAHGVAFGSIITAAVAVTVASTALISSLLLTMMMLSMMMLMMAHLLCAAVACWLCSRPFSAALFAAACAVLRMLCNALRRPKSLHCLAPKHCFPFACSHPGFVLLLSGVAAS